MRVALYLLILGFTMPLLAQGDDEDSKKDYIENVEDFCLEHSTEGEIDRIRELIDSDETDEAESIMAKVIEKSREKSDFFGEEPRPDDDEEELANIFEKYYDYLDKAERFKDALGEDDQDEAFDEMEEANKEFAAAAEQYGINNCGS